MKPSVVYHNCGAGFQPAKLLKMQARCLRHKRFSKPLFLIHYTRTAIKISILILASSIAFGANPPEKISLGKEPFTRELKIADKCHTQGIAFDEKFLYLSCVDQLQRLGWIYRLERLGLESGKLIYQKLNVTRGGQYHPSGLDLTGSCLWVAVAEYHPSPARSTLVCIERDFFKPARYRVFDLNDHIGALATMKNWLVGLNWDAKDFYLMDYTGQILVKGPNPGKTAYQDCKYLEGDDIICSGAASALSGSGYVDIIQIPDLDPDNWKVKIRITAERLEKRSTPLTREGMAVWKNKIYFLPDDLPNPVLYQFDLPGGRK